ncbi:Retrovirus-related Pol polyprotein from transposon gypsy [Glycine max]|nr:Retrovirus-related Pol polyprotein from transposon gypsy [Glycine max]
MKREKHASYSSHDSCKSLSEELSDYYRGRHSSHTKHHSQRREKDKRPQEVNISLPYFHGKDNVEAYLDWEMKVEQLFACHHISEERKVPLATLSFQGYALYWWTSLVRERRIHGDPPIEYWNNLKSVLKKRHIPSYYERKLMDKLQRLRQGSMSIEEYRQQMELLLLRAGLREEERTSIARFLSGLNMEVRDKVELLPYRDLDELVQLCIRVEQQLKRKPSSKSYGSHSYPRKDQAHGILGVAPSKPKEDKGKTIEKYTPKTSSQERTSNIKFFKCLGRGHIASQCPTKKTMIMRGQDIYSSQEETTSCPSSSGSEDEVRGGESSEEVYPHEEGDLLMAKGKGKEVNDSSKKIVKKENHFATKGDIKRELLLKQSFYLLLSREKSLSTAIPLELEVIPQVKELLDEGLVRNSLNPCALLVPKIGIIRPQIPMIGGMMNMLRSATLFSKITHAPNIFMVCVHRDSLGRFVLIFCFNANLGAHVGHLRFVVIFCRNNQHENKEKGMFYSITFLKFLNSDQGLPMDPKRIKVILEWPTTPSIREIWGFNILANFYKWFVPYFSILVAPLIEWVRNYILSWEDGQEKGFQSLPYSNIPNITNTYVLRKESMSFKNPWI